MVFLQNRDTQTLIPLTVKQISEAFHSSDDKMNLLVDGVEVNNVGIFLFLFVVLNNNSFLVYMEGHIVVIPWFWVDFQVKMVGLLKNKTERVTDIQFVVDDGTGCIDCFRWLSNLDALRIFNLPNLFIHLLLWSLLFAMSWIFFL